MRTVRSTALLLVTAMSAFAQAPMHLTLADAERLAVTNNPRFQVSRLDAAAQHQVTEQERAANKPNVVGSLTAVGADSGTRLAAGSLTNPAIYNRAAAGLTATQLLTDFGRTRNLTQSANLRAQASDQSSLDTRAQVLVGVDRAYFELLRANALMQVAQDTVKTRQLMADQISALAASKLRSSLDVSFAMVNLGQAQLLLSSAQNETHSAEADLANALGLPGQTGSFTLEESTLPDPLPASPDPLVAQALHDRPDVVSLRLQQTAAERFTEAERDLALPTIELAGSAGFVPAGDVQVPGRFGAVGVNVNVPILNGGLFRARRSEAELRAQSAAQGVLDLQNRVTRDVRVAWLASQTAFDRLNLTQQVLEQSRLALDLAQQRYNLGLGSIVELSQAQLNVTSAQIDSAAAKYDYESQRSTLAFTIGALR